MKEETGMSENEVLTPEMAVRRAEMTEGSHKKAAEHSLETVKALPCKSKEDYAVVASTVKDIKGEWKRLNEERKRLKEPITKAGKQIEDLFREPLAILRNAETVLKDKAGTYLHKMDDVRRRKEAAAQEAVRKKRERLEEKATAMKADGKEGLAREYTREAESLVPKTVEKVESEGIHTRDVWILGDVDIKALAKGVIDGNIGEEALLPNEEFLLSICKASGGNLQIPGVQWAKKRVVAVR